MEFIQNTNTDRAPPLLCAHGNLRTEIPHSTVFQFTTTLDIPPTNCGEQKVVWYSFNSRHRLVIQRMSLP